MIAQKVVAVIKSVNKCRVLNTHIHNYSKFSSTRAATFIQHLLPGEILLTRLEKQ